MTSPKLTPGGGNRAIADHRYYERIKRKKLIGKRFDSSHIQKITVTALAKEEGEVKVTSVTSNNKETTYKVKLSDFLFYPGLKPREMSWLTKMMTGRGPPTRVMRVDLLRLHSTPASAKRRRRRRTGTPSTRTPISPPTKKEIDLPPPTNEELDLLPPTGEELDLLAEEVSRRTDEELLNK